MVFRGKKEQQRIKNSKIINTSNELYLRYDQVIYNKSSNKSNTVYLNYSYKNK